MPEFIRIRGVGGAQRARARDRGALLTRRRAVDLCRVATAICCRPGQPRPTA